MQVKEGAFAFSDRTRVVAEGEAAAEARKLIDALEPAFGRRLELEPGAADAPDAIRLRVDRALQRELGSEGYRLRVKADGIDMAAAEPAGLFYGVQTLQQLLPPAVYARAPFDSPRFAWRGQPLAPAVYAREPAEGVEWTVPCVEITDYPRFAWRGLLIDPARHFIPVEDVKRFIDLMAMHKFNRLQIHLNDDQGWRIEIKKYPRLTEVGAWREETLIGHSRQQPHEFDGQRHGGFYTQDDIRELVRYAAERHVTIVPEISMPGHSQAAIVAYPELGVFPEKQQDLQVWTRWGISEHILAPRPRTIEFCKDVLREVMALFPSRYIHIGGDEAIKNQWKASEEMQALIRDLGLENEEQLQAWFTGQMDAFLVEHGWRLVGWDEILEGGLAPGAVVMSWRGEKGGITAAQAGHDVIMAPTSHTYFDYYQGPAESEPLAIGGLLPLARVYEYEPVPAALTPEQAPRVLGAQAQLWGEYIKDAAHREYLAYPRACALAEVLWSAEKEPFDAFLLRLESHLARLRVAEVNFRPLDGPSPRARALRLVPFPKEVRPDEGAFPLAPAVKLEFPETAKESLVPMVIREFQQAGTPKFSLRPLNTDAKMFRISLDEPGGDLPEFHFRPEATGEDYILEVRPREIVAGSPGETGLIYAAQTLRQLLRANRRDGGLPCLTIRDWPSLRWRAFQDDVTRGPSPLIETLKLHADLGSYFKMNLFTYYMEYQFAFRKHPAIGPEDGSLTAEELAELVAYARPLGVDVLGNQQSFGHFHHILKHERYAHLRETGNILCPVKDESYQLLDDLYSEVCPLLPFPMFNVCCDETFGLGTGPSKELAGKIGVGGVYVEHIRRVHRLLKENHGKRMMMWGDIILEHPDHLAKIPKDTVMLTWGYAARDSFEHQIIPFAESGYEFFVCPGVSNWSRILPDFGVATVNIHNFVRDGVKHGAAGMLNTDWKDDGESLNAPSWHGYAWGAECAWNGSATSPADFNRRLGAVLFGEAGDRFGRGVERLGEAHRLAGMEGMNNRRFWTSDFLPQRPPAAIVESASRLLDIVRPAIDDLEACRAGASHHAELLDTFLHGARRMELIGQRALDGLEAARLYTQAADPPPAEAAPLVARVESLVRTNRDAHEALGRQFEVLWRRESKPYALDWTMSRYAAAVQWYDAMAGKLADARAMAEAGRTIPRPEDLGLVLPEAFPRRARPYQVLDAALAAETPWHEPAATHRLGMVVRAGSAERRELPLEVLVALPEELAAGPVRAFCLLPGREPQEIAVQLDGAAGTCRVPSLMKALPAESEDGSAPVVPPAEELNQSSDRGGRGDGAAPSPSTRRRLVALIPGPVPSEASADVFVYLGLPEPPPALPQAVSTTDGPDGMKWIENDRVRLLLGPEGAHVYRWELKALGGRDLTMPGASGWAGFADMNVLRGARFELECVARGPALVRYECREPSGLVKTIGLFAGASWMEVILSEPAGTYWDFDNPANFAADGPAPGTYLFSTGATGPVGQQADGVPAQVKATAHWCIKFNAAGLALGLCTPEVAARHVVAPGAGAGGVGIESSPPTNHFITFAGVLQTEPAETMTRLRAALDLNNQPQAVVHAVQKKN
jgi:hexosaminidase